MYFSYLFVEQQKPFSFLLLEYTHFCLHINTLKVPKMDPHKGSTQVNSTFEQFLLIFCTRTDWILDLGKMEGQMIWICLPWVVSPKICDVGGGSVMSKDKHSSPNMGISFLWLRAILGIICLWGPWCGALSSHKNMRDTWWLLQG